MNIFLETDRLILTCPALQDLEDLYLLQSDPDVMTYIGNGVRNRDEVKDGLMKAIAHHKKHGFSLCSVFEKQSKKFIGRAGLIYLAYDDSQPDIEVGYAFIKEFWNKGYGTELAQALIKWGFANINVNFLVGIIKAANQKSRNVLQKSGMHYVGKSLYNNQEVARYEIHKNTFSTDDVELIPAKDSDYSIIENMAQYYIYEICSQLSPHEGWSLTSDGLYEGIKNLKTYWENENHFPLLVRVDGYLAGFALIHKEAHNPRADWVMGEFFVMAQFQKKGIASYVAKYCFDKFPGIWELMVIPGNERAYRFWRRTINEYTHGDFEEHTQHITSRNLIRNVFVFDTGKEDY